MPFKDKEKEKEWRRNYGKKRTQLARQAKQMLGIPLDRRKKPVEKPTSE